MYISIHSIYTHRRNFCEQESLLTRGRGDHTGPAKNFSGLVNICSGDSVSFIEIINNIKKITKMDFKFRYKKRTRPKVNHIMNNSYLKKIIGKYKFIKVEDGLKKLIYEKN